MNPRVTTTCDRCGGKAEAEVVPDDFSDRPATFTRAERCNAGCPPNYVPMTREQAFEMTKHAYDGSTGQWTRLPS